MTFNILMDDDTRRLLLVYERVFKECQDIDAKAGILFSLIREFKPSEDVLGMIAYMIVNHEGAEERSLSLGSSNDTVN